ncbi:FAD-dependent oxidoreductase [Bacillus taeanensis]|uniref:FAD-dependent oxidoreductase n=1 Tax=Bacillus taeanensis TaxID=273032 RepID=A0A366XS84_9BACI|nr:FAD-dependent oxidoreductase [Bacillus taeanensis]RBW69240.1 FAD-dependent oxidoreductase [Bacillus taeanensis]
MTEDNKRAIPQYPEPFWRESIHLPTYERLSEDISVDAAIVGGGITGVTAAYLLAKEGLNVILLEAGRILNGTTGHTTAKITTQHDLIYDEFLQHFGEEKSKLYYEANTNALNFIKHTVNELKMDCDFTDEDAYLYSTSYKYAEKIEKEYKAYQTLGINGETVKNIPFDIPTTAALIMKNQAQFHPLKYLAVLVNEFTKLGGIIYEQTTAVDIKDDLKPTIYTRDGHKVSCDNVLICSHFPFYDGLGFYFSRMYAEKSYVIGVKTKKNFPGGMYLSVDETVRSLRSTTINGNKLVLIGGESHKTGQGIDTMLHYNVLETFADEVLGIKEYLYRWSAQDLITLDKLPYIGRISTRHPNILVATGYRKWGMTNGTAAALLMRDIILEKKNPYEELYTPSRFKADPTIKNFIVQNADVAAHLLEGKFDLTYKRIDELAHDEGAVVRVNGKRAGAYKDSKGCLHIVDTTCTHLGCEVEWNGGDRTWDCPCHGSRYSIEGEVIEGPANKSLKKIDEN